MLLLHVICQNYQQILLINLIPSTLSHMIVTWHNMVVNEADSSINFSITISTRKGRQLSYCCRDVSGWRSNCTPHQRSSIVSGSWNTQQNSCFGGHAGAPALASANGQGREKSSQISLCTPQYTIFFTAYLHSVTFSEIWELFFCTVLYCYCFLSVSWHAKKTHTPLCNLILHSQFSYLSLLAYAANPTCTIYTQTLYN